jgi:DNA-binding LytR/AlgR family response regulator
MRVLIVEDEGPALRRLEALLRAEAPDAEVVGRCDGVASASLWLRQNPEPDLILLDVQLGDGVAFEIFRHVAVHSPVILTTAYDQYALRAFELHSVDYLLKPVTPEALRSALRKLRDMRNRAPPAPAWPQLPGSPKHRTRFLVERRNELLLLPVDDVGWFCAQHKMTAVATRGGRSYFLDQPLEAVEADLDPQRFFRVSRQFVVAAGAIELIEKLEGGRLALRLKPPPPDGLYVTVSRSRVAEFRAWLDR